MPPEIVVVNLVVVALSRRLRRLQHGAVVRVALSGSGHGAQDSATRTVAARSGSQEIGAIAQRIGTHAFNRQGKRGRTKHLIITKAVLGFRFSIFDFCFRFHARSDSRQYFLLFFLVERLLFHSLQLVTYKS